MVTVILQRSPHTQQIDYSLAPTVFLDEYFGIEEFDLPVLLIHNGTTDSPRLAGIAKEELTTGEEHLRVNAIRMQRKSQPDDLVGILLSLARHIVFGDVGQFVGLHIDRLSLPQRILVARQCITEFLALEIPLVLFVSWHRLSVSLCVSIPQAHCLVEHEVLWR